MRCSARPRSLGGADSRSGSGHLRGSARPVHESDDWRGTENDAILRGIAERSTSTSYWIGVEGTEETDLVGMPLLSPLGARFGWKGPIPAGRIIPIIDRYLVGFFDVYLLGTGSPWIARHSRRSAWRSSFPTRRRAVAGCHR